MKKIIVSMCLMLLFVVSNISEVSAYGDTINNATSKSIDTRIYGSISPVGDIDWFMFETNGGGAFNVYTTGSTDTYARLYEQDTYRCGFLWLSTCVDDILLQSDNYPKFPDPSDNFYFERNMDSNHEYFLQVTGYAGDTGSYYLYFERNLDTWYQPSGGEWTPNLSKGDPDGSLMGVENRLFLDEEMVVAYYITMAELERTNGSASIDDVMEILADEAISLGLGVYGPIYSIAKGIFDLFIPSEYDVFMGKLVDASGLTLIYSDTLGYDIDVQNGVVIQNSYVDVFTCIGTYLPYCYYQRVDVKEVDTWTDNNITGVIGYRGDKNDFE